MDPVYNPYRQAAASAAQESLSPPGFAGGGGPPGFAGGPGGLPVPYVDPDPNMLYESRVPLMPNAPTTMPSQGAGAQQADVNPQLQVPGMQQPAQAPSPAVNEYFAERFKAFQNAVRQAGGEIYPFSMARTQEEQNQLCRRAVDKYGDEKLARQYVSPAGSSRHEDNAGIRFGLGPGAIAADLRGDLAIASRLAPLFGLEFNDKNSPWHVTIAGLK